MAWVRRVRLSLPPQGFGRMAGSLRVRLLVLVVLSFLPALVVLLITLSSYRDSERQRAREQALTAARTLSAEQDRAIEQARQALRVLGELPPVRDRDPEACTVMLASILRASPGHRAFWVTDAEGVTICSAPPVPAGTSNASSQPFQQALATRAFAVGEYQIGRFAGVPVLAMAYPALDFSGNVAFVVQTSLDLTWFNQELGTRALPAESILTVLDRNGTVLARTPRDDGIIGQPFPIAGVREAAQAARPRTIEATGLDGRWRVFGVTPLGPPSLGLFAAVGTPASTTFARANRVYTWGLGTTAVAGLGALMLAASVSTVAVVRPIHTLIQTADRLRAGDLSTRSGVRQGNGELARLGAAVDDMAAALEARETARRQAEDALEAFARLLRLINDNTDAGIFAWDMQRQRTYVNPAVEVLTGYTAEEIMTEPSITFVHPDDMGWLRERWETLFDGASYTAEYRLITKCGELKWAQSVWGPIHDEHGVQIGVQGSVRDITAHKAMQDDLRASEERFRGLFEVAPDAMVIVNRTGAITLANEQAEQMFGYTREELIGQSVDLLVPDNALAQHAGHRAAYATQSHPREMGAGLDLYARRKDGSPVPVAISLSQFDVGQEPLILSAIRDISERKRAEEALQRSERKFRTLVANIPNSTVALFDQNLRYLVVGGQALADASLTAEQLVGKAFREVWPAEVAEANEPVLRTALAGEGRTVELGYGGIHQLLHTVPIRDEDGQVVSALALRMDISARKQAEVALRASEERFKALVQHAVDLTTIVDAEGTIRYISPAVERLGGYQPEELIGEQLADLVHPDDHATMAQHHRERLEHPGVPILATARFRRRDGTWRSIEGYGTNYLENPTIRGIVFNSRDVTEQKLAQEQLAQQAQELRRSNQELEQFAYIASHDLQEPLRSISGFAQLLAERYAHALDADADEFIAFIVDGAHRMQALLEDLLAYSRVGSQGQPFVAVSLEDVLERTLHNLQAAIAETGVTVTHDPLPVVWGDPIQLMQLLQNLISNAIKFHGDAPPAVHLDAERQEGAWLMRVRDNGIGIAPAYAERIFGIFQRLHTRTAYSGTGIGLAICRRIVERHGGRIWVNSTPGCGATFSFTLPDGG